MTWPTAGEEEAWPAGADDAGPADLDWEIHWLATAALARALEEDDTSDGASRNGSSCDGSRDGACIEASELDGASDVLAPYRTSHQLEGCFGFLHPRRRAARG